MAKVAGNSVYLSHMSNMHAMALDSEMLYKALS